MRSPCGRTSVGLVHWICEYEAHNAIMEMAPIMDELELHDERRRQAVDEFSILHALSVDARPLPGAQVTAGEEEERLSKLRAEKVTSCNTRSLKIQTEVTAEHAKFNTATSTLAILDHRKGQYDIDHAEERAKLVDAMPAMETRLKSQKDRLSELEASFKSVVDVFDKMDAAARKGRRR